MPSVASGAAVSYVCSQTSALGVPSLVHVPAFALSPRKITTSGQSKLMLLNLLFSSSHTTKENYTGQKYDFVVKKSTHPNGSRADSELNSAVEDKLCWAPAEKLYNCCKADTK